MTDFEASRSPDAQTPVRRPSMVRRAVRLVGLTALALALYAVAVIVVFDVSRPTAYLRAQGPRLSVTPKMHAGRPFDAPFEASMWVGYRDVPRILVDAVITREDRRFFEHHGIDFAGLGRAAMSLGSAGGGSTITQQVAKLLFAGRDPTLLRKANEVVVALWLEAILTKEDILELYLNTAYFGGGLRGVEAAARRRFGLSFLRGAAERRRLDAVMAAEMAAALARPDLFAGPDAAQYARIARLLRDMRARGVDIGSAPAEPVALARRIDGRKPVGAAALPRSAEHRDRSVATVADVAPNLRAVYEAAPFLRGDHQLYLARTAADLRADAALARDYPHALGYVIDIRSGGVTAQIGEATRVYPGSLTKPFILLAALLEGARLDDVALDAPYGDPPAIHNHGRGYLGRISLRAALRESVNAPFARIVDDLGLPALDRAFAALAVEPWLSTGGAPGRVGRRTLALGAAPVALAGMLDGYLALASCGRTVRHGHVAAIWRPGALAPGWRFDARPAAGPPDPRLVRALTDIQGAMREAAGHGTARRLGRRFPGPVAAKTGTADDGRQFGMIAFTDRWLVYLSFWTDAPAGVGASRAGGSLGDALARLMTNLHIGAPAGPLSCASAPAPEIVAAR